jgi:hypothetical protein
MSDVKKIQMIEEEIEVLKSRIEEHGTGHIHTTISVLENRVRELNQQELDYQRSRNKNYAELND